MIFCSNCFKDTEVKAIIESSSNMGICPVCGKNGVKLYDTDLDNSLTLLFDDLIGIYTPESLLPPNYPNRQKRLLKNALLDKWDIFNKLDDEQVYSILKEICKEKYNDVPELFDKPIALLEAENEDYIFEHSLLKSNTWEDFTRSIISDNRFHTQHIKLDILERILSYLQKTYKKGARFFRSRISPNSNGFNCVEMSAPPADFSTAGRANCDGISCLYLANEELTTIHEIRASAFDYVTIGEFELKKDIIVIDLKIIDKISPFVMGLDILEYAINKNHLKKINTEMAKTLRRTDNPTNYIPTQYISDFVKSLYLDKNKTQKYAGIEYGSTMSKIGYNLAIFNPDDFTCINVQTKQIDSLNYNYSNV